MVFGLHFFVRIPYRARRFTIQAQSVTIGDTLDSKCLEAKWLPFLLVYSFCIWRTVAGRVLFDEQESVHSLILIDACVFK